MNYRTLVLVTAIKLRAQEEQINPFTQPQKPTDGGKKRKKKKKRVY